MSRSKSGAGPCTLSLQVCHSTRWAGGQLSNCYIFGGQIYAFANFAVLCCSYVVSNQCYCSHGFMAAEEVVPAAADSEPAVDS